MDKESRVKRPASPVPMRPETAGARLTRTDAVVVLKTRRSIREFTDRKIDDAILRDIVDCGRHAATAVNLQPWEFVVVQEPARLQALADITDHGKFIAQAAACVAVFCKNVKYYVEDGSAAIQNILVAAWAHGVASCWVAGDKKSYCETLAERLNVPSDADLRLVGLIALGYPAEKPQPLEKRPLDEVLHWETF